MPNVFDSIVSEAGTVGGGNRDLLGGGDIDDNEKEGIN